MLDGVAREAALEAYLDDLLTHDVDQVEELAGQRRGYDRNRLRRFFEAYAVNSSGVVDAGTLYEAADVNRETAIAYEQLLADLFVVESVPAWSTNRRTRVTNRPKRYVIDPALIAAALRIDVNGIVRDGRLLGRMIDTFVAAQLRPEAAISESRPRLYHLRTKGGRQEVDLLAELGGERVIGIEMKATAAPTSDDARHLAWLRDQTRRTLRPRRRVPHRPTHLRVERFDHCCPDQRPLGAVKPENGDGLRPGASLGSVA